MKKTLLATTAIAVLFVIPAQAADMPVKAPPPAAVMTSWEGFYIGAHVGYGHAVTATSVQGLNGRIIGAGSKGWVAGGLGGYNMMLAPRWVAGIELDASWQDIATRVDFVGAGTGKGSADWSASVRARLGWLMTPTTMLFGTAGWSWSAIDISHNVFIIEQFSKSVQGPQVGFGVETMYAPNWIIRTEYLHSFYDRAEFNSQLVGGPATFSPWVGVIRSALIYKPGPSNQMAWPDRAPTPIWAGLYVGGMVGPLMGNGKLSVPSQGVTIDGAGLSAVIPSATAGYNFQIAPRWLVGVEAEIAPNIATSDVKIQWTGAARVRAGYLVTPTVLAYGTVGWGTAGVNDFTRSGTNIVIPIERVHAIGFGTGLEAAITDRWRLRADYQYYFADTINIILPGNIPTSVKPAAQTARLGATYQLSGP